MTSAYTPPPRLNNYWSGRTKILVVGGIVAVVVLTVVGVDLLHRGSSSPPLLRSDAMGGGLGFPISDSDPPPRLPRPRPVMQSVMRPVYQQTEMPDPALMAGSEIKNEDGAGGVQALNSEPKPPSEDTGASDDVPAAKARVDRHGLYEISMGRHIPCNIDVAIDTQLPGPITCVIPEPVMNDDQTIELLPKGTHVTGQIMQSVVFGNDRVVALWTEIRTSDDPPIKVKIKAPAADELGRAGIPGAVNDHFWSTLLATAVYSLVEYGPQLATAAIQNGSSATNLFAFNEALTPQQGMADRVLEKYLNRPPTLEAHQGTRLDIITNQDIDCFGVVQIRMRDTPP